MPRPRLPFLRVTCPFPLPFGHSLSMRYYLHMPQLESLEPRQLLAASLSDGILRVSGTSAADDIAITLHSRRYRVNINGTTSSFAASAVRELTVRGRGGADDIHLSGPMSSSPNVRGDGGDDTIVGSRRDDLLVGGDGDD